jgi:PAS domain S-box-containing protein
MESNGLNLESKTAVSWPSQDNSKSSNDSWPAEFIDRSHKPSFSQKFPGVLFQFRLEVNGQIKFTSLDGNGLELFGLETNCLLPDIGVLIDRIDSRDRDSFWRVWNRAAKLLKTWQWQGRIIVPNQGLKLLQITAQPEQEESGSSLWTGCAIAVLSCSNICSQANATFKKQLDISIHQLNELNEQLESKVNERTAALQKTTTELQAILDNSPAVIYLKDCEGRFLRINQKFQQLFNLKAEEIIGKRNEDLFPPEIAQEFSINDTYVLEQALPLECEETALINNKIHTYLSLKFPIFDREGKPYAICGISTDITERKHLKQERDRFFKLSMDLFGVAGFDGYFKQVNPAFSRSLGYSSKELESQPFIDFAHPDDREETLKQAERLTAGNMVVSFENRYRRKDGSYCWLSWNSVSHPEEQLIYATARDISDRKQAERERQILVASLENSSDFIAMADLEGRIFYLNAAGQKMVGIEANEAVKNTNINDYLFPEDWERTQQEILPIVYEKGSWRGEFRLRHCQTGEAIALDYHVFLVKNPQTQEPLCLATVSRDIRERQEAENRLRASEQKLHNILSSLQDVVWSANPETGQITYINDVVERIYGYTAAEFYQHPTLWLDAVHPDDFDRVREYNQVLFAEGSKELEYRIIRPDGQVRWLRDRAYLIRDRDSNVISLNGIATDITARKEVENRLRESEQRYQTLAETSPNGVYYTDANGDCLYINQTWVEITGLSLDRANGKGWGNALHPDDRDRVFEEWYQATQDGRPFRTECRFIKPNGDVVWAISQALAVTNSDNEIVGYVGTITDITDRQKTEAKLQSLARHLQQAQRIARIGNWEYNFVTTTLTWSDQLFRIFGRSPSQGEPMLEDAIAYYHPDDQPCLKTALERTKLTGKPHEIELRIVPQDGDLRYVHVKMEAVCNDEDEITAIFGTVMDISDRKLAEIQLQQQTRDLEKAIAELQQAQSHLIQSEKMSSLGQLVAGVAHEINNPVNFIHGNLVHTQEYTENLLEIIQAYQQHYPQPHSDLSDLLEELDLEFLIEDFPRLLKSMHVGTNRIREIVTSLRNFSRLDEAEVKDVNIHEGLENTLMILQNRLKEKAEHPAVEVVKNYGNLPKVECYPGQLNQVFMNIIVNALDAFDQLNQNRSYQEIKQNPNIITITTDLVRSGWVEIAIRDNGPGMSEAIQKRIFDPFFTTKVVGKGTGLGMSISYKIITERHCGKLSCSSTPNCGAEFKLEIPLFQPEIKR